MQKILTITTIITLTTIALIYISAIKETSKLNLKSSFKSFASNEPWDDYDFTSSQFNGERITVKYHQTRTHVSKR
jgi:hypothetical protein